jgi:phenylacetate-CoA ligase
MATRGGIRRLYQRRSTAVALAAQIEELILGTPQLAPYYVLEVTRDGHLDSMTVHAEALAEEQSVLAEAAEQLAQRVKSYIGIGVEVNVGRPGCIDRSLGKAKHVIDKRNLSGA